MRVVPYLPRLKQRHVHQLDALLVRLDALPNARTGSTDREIASCVIEAVNSFDRFCRFLYLSSALGARDASGVKVVAPAARPQGIADAIDRAYFANFPNRNSRPINKEPDWKVPAQLIKSLDAVGSSNSAAVQAALSTNPAAVQRLPVFRNFYAHRGQDTALKALSQARQLSVVVAHPTDFLLHRRPVDAVVVEWIFDLQVMVDLMA